MDLLNKLAQAALEQREGKLTFDVSTVKTKASNNGNVGFIAITNTGQRVTFWKSNADQVVAQIGDTDEFEILAGVTIAQNGGLIPAGAQSKDFFEGL